MIRIDDPARLGPALEDLRTLLGVSRRGLARAVANRLCRDVDSINSQLWGWERGHRLPGAGSLAAVLAELGYGLALVPLDQEAPEAAPESTLADEHPSAGVPGWVEGAEGESGASEGCGAETWSWNHFTPDQTDGYWITCDLQDTHSDHRDEHTGLTWKGFGDVTENDQPKEA